MPVCPALSASVRAVGALMAAARDPWWIISSAAVALHGADAGEVADVDVLLSEADARAILPGIGIECLPGPEHPAFRSGIFAAWTGTALPVEFMAGFCHFSGGAWVPVQPVTRKAVDVGGATVFIPERAELHAMLTGFGRPKDLVRARSLTADRDRRA